MMKNIKIMISKKTNQVNLEKSIIGNEGENLQSNLQFEFEDEFIDGQARLEYKLETSEEKKWISLVKIDKSYQVPIKSVLTKAGKTFMQIVITEGTNEKEIPIYKSNIFYVVCGKSINAEIEAEDEYLKWIEIANTKLNQIENLDLDGEKVENVATFKLTKKDGSTKIININDGEKGEKGDTGEKGDSYVLTEQDKIDIGDISAENAKSKLNKHYNTKVDEFNNHAADKVKEYDNNAKNKITDYDKNTINKINSFNENAKTKSDEFNQNAASYDQRISDNFDEINRLTAETSDNAQNIGLLKQEQTLQNQALQKNVDDIINTDKKTKLNTNRVQNVERTLFENGEASGEFINIKDSALAEMQEISYEVNKAQETTEGYQLFDEQTITYIDNGTIANDIITSNEVTTSTVNVVVSFSKFIEAKSKIYFSADIRLKDNATGRFGNLNDGVNAGTEIIKNQQLTKEWQRYITAIDYTSKPAIIRKMLMQISPHTGQIEFRNLSISTDKGGIYEPYTGGIPAPNPDYPRPISIIKDNFNGTSCGKNLINLEDINQTINGITVKREGNYIVLNGTASIGTGLTLAKNIKVKNNYYTMSANVIPKKVFISLDNKSNAMLNSDEFSKTFITDAKVYSKLIMWIDPNAVLDNVKIRIQLEEGSTKTEYEPYQGITNLIDLKGNEVLPGDELKIEFDEATGTFRKKLYKNNKEDVLNGDEGFVRSTTTGMVVFVYNGLYYPIYKSNSEVVILSNYFRGVRDWDGNIIGTIRANSRGQVFIVFKDTDPIAQSLDTFKQWLATNNMKVVYKLADEYKEVIDLGEVNPMFMTYNNITNIFTNKDNILQRLKYYRDFVYTIRNLQVDNDTLQNQLQSIESKLLNKSDSVKTIWEGRLKGSEKVKLNITKRFIDIYATNAIRGAFCTIKYSIDTFAKPNYASGMIMAQDVESGLEYYVSESKLDKNNELTHTRIGFFNIANGTYTNRINAENYYIYKIDEHD